VAVNNDVDRGRKSDAEDCETSDKEFVLKIDQISFAQGVHSQNHGTQS
jgi:hypothetical protein